MPLRPNCWKFEPGIVLALERATELATAHVWLSPAEAAIFFPSSGRVLRRYHTPPGDELRVLAELWARRNVVSASLNFFGTTPGGAITGETAVPGLESACFFTGFGSEKTEAKELFTTKNEITLRGIPEEEPIALIVDVESTHAECVAYQLTEAYRERSGGRSCRYITLTTRANLKSSADMCTFCRLLMVAGEIKNRIAVVNLSVDLGQLCRGYSDTPEAAVLYSFPFFETCLDEFLSAHRRRHHGDAPVIVAAAGNRVNEESVQWRLGYPASLPDVVAVTCFADKEAGFLSQIVDCPAVGPLKPCFAESASPFKGYLAATRWARKPETTSFASAAFAGRAMAVAEKWVQADSGSTKIHQTGGLGKLRWLVRGSTPKKVSSDSGTKRWAPPVVWCLNDAVGGPGSSSDCGPFQQLLRDLYQDTRREYLLTGSAAFVEAWLDHYKPKLDDTRFSEVLFWIGDLDLLHTGAWPDDDGRLQVFETIYRWAKSRASAQILSRLRVTAHPLRTWAGALYLLQCVIPDVQLLATTEGVIDPWGLLPSVFCSELPRLFVPPPQIWELNPQTRTGVAGLADGVLLYLNRLMLEVLLETLRVEPPDMPKWLTAKRFPGAVDELLRKTAVDQLLPDTGVKENELWFWFGAGSQPPCDGLKRRLKRSKALLQWLKKVTAQVAAHPVNCLMRTVEQYVNSFEQGAVPESLKTAS